MPLGNETAGLGAFYRPGNWVGSWGVKPPDLGHQTGFSYFQQNPNQIGNYWQQGSQPRGGTLGWQLQNAFPNYWGGAQFQPSQPQAPNAGQPMKPFLQPPPATGYGNPYQGDTGGMPPPQLPQSPIFRPPNLGQPMKPWMNQPIASQPVGTPSYIPHSPLGPPKPGTDMFATQGGQPGISGYRGKGWF